MSREVPTPPFIQFYPIVSYPTLPIWTVDGGRGESALLSKGTDGLAPPRAPSNTPARLAAAEREWESQRQRPKNVQAQLSVSKEDLTPPSHPALSYAHGRQCGANQL